MSIIKNATSLFLTPSYGSCILECLHTMKSCWISTEMLNLNIQPNQSAPAGPNKSLVL